MSTNGAYGEVERSERAPKRVVDHSAKWAKLEPVGAVNGQVEERLRHVLRAEADHARRTRRRSAHGSRVRPGHASSSPSPGDNGDGRVTAIKYRPLDGSSHESTAENAVDLAAADRRRQARLARLARRRRRDGRRAAVRARRRRRGDPGAPGRRSHLQARVGRADPARRDASRSATTPTRTATPAPRRPRRSSAARRCACGRRSRAATGATGTAAATSSSSSLARERSAALRVLDARRLPRAPVPEGRAAARRAGRDPPRARLAAHGVRRRRQRRRSTWTIDGIAHLAAGVDWLGIPVPRPVRICVIENEGPPCLFQQKLAAKIATLGRRPTSRTTCSSFTGPWGEFTFADAGGARGARRLLRGARRSTSSPPTRRSGSASPPPADPTRRSSSSTGSSSAGSSRERAFWLLHHENKAGQISGDWGRHPDTKVQLQQDGNQPRTKLDWAKTRWATLPTETSREGVACSSGSSRRRATPSPSSTPRAPPTTSSRSRLVEFLREHPWSTTRAVWDGREGHERPPPAAPRRRPIRLRRRARGARSLWRLAGDCDGTSRRRGRRRTRMETRMNKGFDRPARFRRSDHMCCLRRRLTTASSAP